MLYMLKQIRKSSWCHCTTKKVKPQKNESLVNGKHAAEPPALSDGKQQYDEGNTYFLALGGLNNRKQDWQRSLQAFTPLLNFGVTLAAPQKSHFAAGEAFSRSARAATVEEAFSRSARV